jgi:selenocysteine lyase/cysteine desulfurase
MQWRDLVVGSDVRVPVLDGSMRRYVNLDNGASTPPLKMVMEAINDFSTQYSSVHRGTGFKSVLSTYTYNEARRVLKAFFGAHPENDVVIFTKHTTEALNIVAQQLVTTPEEVVLTTELEHHANMLTWRKHHQVDYIALDGQGRLDEDDLDAKLTHYDGRVRLVAISGGSNVTGYMPDLHRLAKKVHQTGARILVDAAQLAAHRKVEMGEWGSPGHLDFVVCSAHKMYAPFGAGALIGPKDFFRGKEPFLVGGGAVDIVTLEDTLWTPTPERDEAGSPNVLGAVALAVACRKLEEIGFEVIKNHERELTSYALRKLAGVRGLRFLGSYEAALAEDRLGVIAFNLEGMPHNLVAAILGYEYAVGVRAGCFCAHPYLLRLLDVREEEAGEHRAAVRGGDKSTLPGAVRISFGIYNHEEDVDIAVEALRKIAGGEYQGSYKVDKPSGEYLPVDSPFEVEDYLLDELRG